MLKIFALHNVNIGMQHLETHPSSGLERANSEEKEYTVGDGEQRENALSKSHASAQNVDAQVGTSDISAVATIDVEALKALQTVHGESITSYSNVLCKLDYHAFITEKCLSSENITEMVVAGENIAKALHDPRNEAGKSPLFMYVGADKYEIKSNLYNTRAISWYMMAAAASQDMLRDSKGDSSASDMLEEGSLRMRDPGNQLYNFLCSAPNAIKRMSTHYEELSGHNEKHYIMGVLPTNKVAQRGIEDYDTLFPGPGGSILFDMLNPSFDSGIPELFVKFEEAGTPDLLSNESNHSILDSAIHTINAIWRNARHCTSFAQSRSQPNSCSDYKAKRQEHLYKGALKPIYDSIIELLRAALNFDLINAQDASIIAKDMKKFGLPAALRALNKFSENDKAQQCSDFIKKVNQALNTIEVEKKKLGFISDDHEIERRGREVHITTDPNQVLKYAKEAVENGLPKTFLDSAYEDGDEDLIVIGAANNTVNSNDVTAARPLPTLHTEEKDNNTATDVAAADKSRPATPAPSTAAHAEEEDNNTGMDVADADNSRPATPERSTVAHAEDEDNNTSADVADADNSRPATPAPSTAAHAEAEDNNTGMDVADADNSRPATPTPSTAAHAEVGDNNTSTDVAVADADNSKPETPEPEPAAQQDSPKESSLFSKISGWFSRSLSYVSGWLDYLISWLWHSKR